MWISCVNILCEVREYFILEQTLVLFDYTGSALKNTGEWFLTKTCSYQKPCLLLTKRILPVAPTKVWFAIFPWNFAYALMYLYVLFCFVFVFVLVFEDLPFRKKTLFS